MKNRLIEIRDGKPFGYIGKNGTVEFSDNVKENILLLNPFYVFLLNKGVVRDNDLFWEYIQEIEEN